MIDEKKRRCFVAQERHDIDFSDAWAYGEVVPVLPINASEWHPREAMREAERRLAEFSDDDFLILTGKPLLIGMVTTIAARNNNWRVNILHWDNRAGKYVPTLVDMR